MSRLSVLWGLWVSAPPYISNFQLHIHMFKSHLRRPARRAVTPGAPASRISDGAKLRTGRCVALVDARFLGWLLQPSGQRNGVDNLPLADQVLHMLEAALRQTALELDLLRVYWYSDAALTSPVPDVVSRTVVDPDDDGGVSLVRALSGDLGSLVAARAVEHVLVVSDDERLLASVDHAQLSGLSVHMLTDDAGLDVARLSQEDPSWARLLSQADRCVVLNATDRMVTTSPSLQPAGADDVQATEPAILAQLQAWWDEEPECQRLDLHDELKFSRSIPQEVDRQLLLRLSRVLGHPLTWPEKKVMRENVRRLVLGNDYTPFSSRPAESVAD